jgi:ABC-type transport system involved in cytochrome bd biosynthesis fused ATPase/permease subunit
MERQKGHAVATLVAAVSAACSTRLWLTRGCSSSIHIRPPPAPQHIPSLRLRAISTTTKITTDAAIAADKLCKRYGDVVALRDLDLHVQPAEVFGFLGPNGAGKSTTIRIMLGFLRPSSGNVRVLGMDSVRDHLEILRHTGYLPGDPAFDAVATGEQALDFVASRRSLRAAAA